MFYFESKPKFSLLVDQLLLIAKLFIIIDFFGEMVVLLYVFIKELNTKIEMKNKLH